MMKKTIVAISTLLLALLLFSSCQKTTKELLIGKWKMVNYSATAESVEEDEEIIKMYAEIRKELLKDHTYTFDVDKVVIKNNDNEILANWVLSIDEKQLTIKLGSGPTQMYDIDIISDVELKIIKKDTEGGDTTSYTFSKE